MDNIEDNAKRISLAAEELIKATYKQTEASGIVVQREVARNIEALQKESVDLKIDVNNKLNCVNKNLQELQKQNVVNQKSMSAMLEAITTLNETIKEEGMKRRVQKAGWDTSDILRVFSEGNGYQFEAIYYKGDKLDLFDICSYMFLLTGIPTLFNYKQEECDENDLWILSQNPKVDEVSVPGVEANTDDVGADFAIVAAATDSLKIDKVNTD